VGPRAGLDGCGKSRLQPGSIPKLSSPWPTLEDSIKMDLRWDRISGTVFI